MYFLAAKSTKNSPADAYAYFVPANVRNGRLFAGLQANRPRFLPLLAGPSFHGFGIGPGLFAAFRGGRDASGTSRKHRSLRSPLEAVFKPPHSRLQRNKNNRQPACPEREAGKGVRRRGQTACCLPSRHSLNGACFCAVKSCSCCARSTWAGGCSRESDMRMVLALLTSLRSFSSFWHGIARKRSLLALRVSVDIKST